VISSATHRVRIINSSGFCLVFYIVLLCVVLFTDVASNPVDLMFYVSKLVRVFLRHTGLYTSFVISYEVSGPLHSVYS